MSAAQDPQPSRRQGKAVSRRSRMRSTSPEVAQRSSTRHSTGAKLRYRFDNALSRGPFVVIAYLALVSVVVVFVTAVVATAWDFRFGGGNDGSFAEGLWQAMLRTLDAGSFAADTAWPTRALALATTLAGIFLAGSLIGLIANAVDQKVEDLRRGRSAVVEAGHTLVLGWSAQVPRIIGELIIANESERSATVVVMARRDKSEMEDELRDRIEEFGTTSVVCRTGNPSSPDDLRRAAIEDARSVVIVRDSDGDAGVVKAILAVRAVDPEFAQAHVVAELTDGDHAETIRSISKGRVLTVSSDDVVAEVTAQACIQAGLAAVFQDLLDFDGDEIYFAPVGGLAGHQYREALLGFERSSVIGRLTTDGIVELNPAPMTVLDPKDELVLVAADDSAVAFSGIRQVDASTRAPEAVPDPKPKTVVIIGWSGFGAKVVRELDEFLPQGSRLEVLVDADLVDAGEVEAVTLEHSSIHVLAGTGGPRDLDGLADGPAPEQVIVLGYRDAMNDDEADARTLLTLISLHQVLPSGGADTRIVAELLDQRNLVLADPAGADDLIVSDALSSLLMAQLSERAELQAVFDDLFDAEGAVIELQSASAFGSGDCTYADLVAAGADRATSVFGYRTAADRRVVLNPPKSTKLALAEGDQLVVVATRDR